MTATRVGIREFRAALADYIEAEAPVVVTRHGQTVGYFIPTKSDRQAEVAALRSAAAKLDAMLKLDEAEVDAAIEEFKQSRRGKKKT